MSIYDDMAAALDGLIGQVCWSIINGTDSMLSLDFGDKIDRDVILTAPTLTEDQQLFEGAYALHIASCTWRLDSPDAIVTAWSDDPRTAMRDGLAYIQDQPVNAWEMTWPGLDLTLHFENTLALRLFCDQTDPVDGGDNYTLLSPNQIFMVGLRSQLHVAPRK